MKESCIQCVFLIKEFKHDGYNSLYDYYCMVNRLFLRLITIVIAYKQQWSNECEDKMPGLRIGS